MRKLGPAYSIQRVIDNIDDALGVSTVKNRLQIDDDYVIMNVDDYLDILDNYERLFSIKIPKSLFSLDSIKLSDLILEFKNILQSQNKKIHNTNDIIQYIEAVFDGEECNLVDQNSRIFLKSQYIDVLEHFETKHKFKIPVELIDIIPTMKVLANELLKLKKIHSAYKYAIFYAKILEDKITKESYMEGPFYGEQADTMEVINRKAKELTDRQQGSAIIIKILERSERTDPELMKVAKLYFGKIADEMNQQY